MGLLQPPAQVKGKPDNNPKEHAPTNIQETRVQDIQKTLHDEQKGRLEPFLDQTISSPPEDSPHPKKAKQCKNPDALSAQSNNTLLPGLWAQNNSLPLNLFDVGIPPDTTILPEINFDEELLGPHVLYRTLLAFVSNLN